jgi:formylglycine-generating enzyme required for sulfatase activity
VVTVNLQGQITNRQQASAPYQTVDLGQGVTLDMVLIPGGSFMMGSLDSEAGGSGEEGPPHQVTLPEFWMGKYPVTQAQWRAVASLPQVERELNPHPSRFKGDTHPVENVSWHEALEFCDRLSQKLGQPYTLPSEAQWEYACRAGTTTPFHFGENITTDLANYRGTDWEWQLEPDWDRWVYEEWARWEYEEWARYEGNSSYGAGPKEIYRKKTTDVGSFPPNGFGLYDMHGNVWEWCLDRWHKSYKGAPADGSAWVSNENKILGLFEKRVLRGGSWDYDPEYCRCAFRRYFFPDLRSLSCYGFRVVSVPPRALG